MYLHREQQIIGWGIERNILGVTGEGSLHGQSLKTIEELNEMNEAIDAGDDDLLRDAIGDVYVTLVMLAYLGGVTLGKIIDSYARPDRNIVARMILTPNSETGLLVLRLNSSLQAMEIDDGIECIRNMEKCLNDIYYHIGIQAAFNGMTMEECVDAAWNEIKDRKGRMVHGIFVKEPPKVP